ncbi:MAG: ABC transporter ATP-binding protein [Azospirillaceae bacterium]
MPEAGTTAASAQGAAGAGGAKGPMLEVRGVAKRFGGLTALEGIGFDVPEGGVVSVIGPNGAGKTTLFNLITGYLPPSEGEILVRGGSILGLTPSRIARLGVVRTFQKTEVFPELTVGRCVETGALCGRPLRPVRDLFRPAEARAFAERARARSEEILALVGLADKRDSLSTNLSYGEQRLLEVAVGLAAEPALLLLDEPASGMNAEEAGHIMSLIRRLAERGMTVCLVEHNMKVVMRISDRVVVINHGRVIADGPPATVARDPQVVAAYLGQGWADAGG